MQKGKVIVVALAAAAISAISGATTSVQAQLCVWQCNCICEPTCSCSCYRGSSGGSQCQIGSNGCNVTLCGPKRAVAQAPALFGADGGVLHTLLASVPLGFQGGALGKAPVTELTDEAAAPPRRVGWQLMANGVLVLTDCTGLPKVTFYDPGEARRLRATAAALTL